MWPRSRWAGLVAAGLAQLALLAGCATVPTSGPVVEHQSDGQQIEPGVRVAPVPPAVDAAPMLVVEGFLHAMGTDQTGFGVARQYLTAAAAASWRPESGTLIYANGYQPRQAEGSTDEQPVITLETVQTGRLSSDGEYHEASGGHRHDFGLVRENGQWRISHPPEGLLISRYHFETNYAAVDLHFMDATGSVLAPDPRYLPQNAITPMRLVELQLAGPGAWLAPAVRRVTWPASVVERVEVLPQNVAVLHLTAAASQLDNSQRSTLMAEVTTTLTAAGLADGLQFSLGTTLLPRPDTTNVTLTATDFAQLAPAGSSTGDLLTLRDGAVHRIAAGEPWREGEPIVSGLDAPAMLAARSDLTEVATVDADGTAVTVTEVASGSSAVLREAAGLLRPGYSRLNELWTIGEGAGASGFVVYGPDEPAAVPVATAPDFPSDAVRAFRVSPDGVRIALVLDGPTVDGVTVEQLGLARIVRSDAGITVEGFRPVTVSPPAEAARGVLDVGWKTATKLLVLVSHRVTASVVEVDQDSAKADDIGPAELAGLRELAVAPGGRKPVLRGAAKAVYRFEGSINWELTGLEADAVAYA